MMTISSELVDLFESFPNLELTLGNLATYNRFRCHEPGLVSCLDDSEEKQEPEVLVIEEKNKPLGVLSLVVKKNKYKAYPANQYARIDLVIVNKNSRSRGIGRLLIFCAITYLLRTRGNRIYSISCLAAHKAVEKVLKDLSFQEHQGQDKNFWQGAFQLEGLDTEELTRRFAEQTSLCLKMTNFRLRQGQDTA